MEIVLLLAILIVAIISLNKIGKNTRVLQQDFKQLNDKFEILKNQLKNQTIQPKVEEKPIVKQEKPSTIDEKVIAPKLETITPPISEKPDKEVEKTKVAAFSIEKEPVKVNQEIPKPRKPIIQTPIVPEKSWVEKFKENNPDIEKFIGENLINKIGILILVLGISFFVKYAIDKDWINEPARVGIGILAGVIVMGVAHRLRKNYAAFSSVFVAGAISIFYLTIGIAFHDYKLFNQTVAFIIMVVITIFSAFVSLSYNRKELAVLSLIGGFAVPFMVSTGEGNYKVLLTYIAILNVGMLIIAYFKKWNLVTLLAFIFTCVLYSSWFGIELSQNKLPYRGALFFISVFYLIFSVATVINNVRNKGSFFKVEYFIMLANTFFFFGMGITIIENWKPEFKGLFTVLLAVYNLVFAIFLYRKFGLNKDSIYFLLGLTLTFVTLAIPIQFQGNYITLFWACEAVLLLWLSQKSKINTFKLGAIIVQILMVVSLLIDWEDYYLSFTDFTLQPFLNKIFITGLVSLGSLYCTYLLLKKENEITTVSFIDINPNVYRYTTLLLALFVGYFVGMLEINYQANEYFSNSSSAISYSILYHFAWSALLIFFILKSQYQNKEIVSIGLSALNILLFICYFYQLSTNEMIENYQNNLSEKSAFIIHYLLVIGVGYFIYTIVKLRNGNKLSKFINHKLALWVLAFCLVYVLSNEVMIHSLQFTRDIVNPTELNKLYPIAKTNDYNFSKLFYIEDQFEIAKIQIIKIGYPILWGVLSFVFLILGIRKQNKQLRIIALSLLGLTILKLFLYDIKNVSETGKIIAFILLGVLILIISFVYQKIKKLVIDEPQNTNHEDNL